MNDQDQKADEQGPVRLRGVLRCTSTEEVETVKRHLPEHTRLTRVEPGCLSFDVSQTDDPLVWKVAESFVDMVASSRMCNAARPRHGGRRLPGSRAISKSSGAWS
jgi:hypothetical protein